MIGDRRDAPVRPTPRRRTRRPSVTVVPVSVALRLSNCPSLCPECGHIWRWSGEGCDEPELERCPGCAGC